MTNLGDKANYLFALIVLAWLLTDSIGGLLS
jgi:hypothetical protein